MIRSAYIQDAAAICSIYNHYVMNSIITFDEEEMSVDSMKQLIEEITRDLPWLVAETDGRIVGYAFASKWKSRCSYRFTAESTIYLDPEFQGKGLGKKLYGQLLDELCTHNLHSIIGGISLPNPASIALHEKLGFEKVAHFKEVGRKFDRWIDVGYWELIL